MDIDEKLIKYIADVAAIELSEEEVAMHMRDMKQLADFVGVLKEVEIGDEPFDSAMLCRPDRQSPMREDVVTNEDMSETLLALAPDRKGPYIRVPRTVEE